MPLWASFTKFKNDFLVIRLRLVEIVVKKYSFQVFALSQLLHKGHQLVGCQAKRRHSETCLAVSETRGWSLVALRKPGGLSIAMSFTKCVH